VHKVLNFLGLRY